MMQAVVHGVEARSVRGEQGVQVGGRRFDARQGRLALGDDRLVRNDDREQPKLVDRPDRLGRAGEQSQLFRTHRRVERPVVGMPVEGVQRAVTVEEHRPARPARARPRRLSAEPSEPIGVDVTRSTRDEETLA
ncbi:MAG TPA: hypothetical protein VGM69_02955 [Chloroflexota bacterium]